MVSIPWIGTDREDRKLHGMNHVRLKPLAAEKETVEV
jgi:hypothetical protein